MTYHVTFSIHAKHPLPINLVELLALGLPFTKGNNKVVDVIVKTTTTIVDLTDIEKKVNDK